MRGPRRADGAYFELVDDKAVIVDPEGRELVTLNRVGTAVWEALDGERDEGSIVDELAGRFPGVARRQLEGDVNSFLAELDTARLLERPA